jgi:hypothetical protein
MAANRRLSAFASFVESPFRGVEEVLEGPTAQASDADDAGGGKRSNLARGIERALSRFLQCPFGGHSYSPFSNPARIVRAWSFKRSGTVS